jgi:hypothetical protein
VMGTVHHYVGEVLWIIDGITNGMQIPKCG